MITKRFYYHSHTVSHGCWGDRTNERARQVGGFSTIRVFYFACKRSCWWVKVLIFFLKDRLSCQTNISVSKNEKWSGLWKIANTGESWFGCQRDDQQIYLWTAILANFSTNDSLGEALLVIFKETVRNSWDISSAILGHKYHQNLSDEWVSGSIVLLTFALRKHAQLLRN